MLYSDGSDSQFQSIFKGPEMRLNLLPPAHATTYKPLAPFHFGNIFSPDIQNKLFSPRIPPFGKKTQVSPFPVR